MKKWLRANRGFLLFLLGFAFFRTAIADWNPVPSGSMRPTILEGDVVLVDRIAYDFKLPLSERSLYRFADPQRGHVVTFFSPRDGTRLVKRIAAVPGDVVEWQGEPRVLGPDEFFMLGDNRGNSADSRVFGVVPRRLIIGRAHRVLVSADIQDHWQPRWERFVSPLN